MAQMGCIACWGRRRASRGSRVGGCPGKTGGVEALVCCYAVVTVRSFLFSSGVPEGIVFAVDAVKEIRRRQ